MLRTLHSAVFAFVACWISIAGCSDRDGGGAPVTTDASGALAVASVPYPADDAASAAKVALGRLLFWDPVLSGDRDVACATCHHPDYAYTDGRALSIGTGGAGLGPSRAAGVPPNETTRNAMTVLDAAWNGRAGTATPDASTAPMFWDARARSLENQAKGPISALHEMRGAAFDETTIFPEIVARLGAIPDYVVRFGSAFSDGEISEENIVRAIATFERTLVDTSSSYDRYVLGDAQALSAEQSRGLVEFGRSGCTGCHTGPMFSDFKLHRIAARRPTVARSIDDGAGGGMFRTASLRNVTRTAPYMHDGAFASLGDVLDLYRNVDENADNKLRALRVPDGSDRADLIAFLGALSDGAYDRTIPEAVPSGLPVGGKIH